LVARYLQSMALKPHYGPTDLTPIMQAGDGIYVKRDDLCEVAGIYGGKVRTCYALCRRAKDVGHTHVVTAGSRHSPQCHIVAAMGQHLGMRVTVHCPIGELGPELQAAAACGAKVVQHRPGYNSVIVKRAQEQAEQVRAYLIPFGMECREAVQQTAGQVLNIPGDIRRIVVPVGSGMSAAGIIQGVKESFGKLEMKLSPFLRIVGVQVGAEAKQRLNKWAPGWDTVMTLVKSELGYDQHVEGKRIAGIPLDPVYEAKCLPYLQPGDLFWLVGIRGNGTSMRHG